MALVVGHLDLRLETAGLIPTTTPFPFPFPAILGKMFKRTASVTVAAVLWESWSPDPHFLAVGVQMYTDPHFLLPCCYTLNCVDYVEMFCSELCPSPGGVYTEGTERGEEEG